MAIVFFSKTQACYGSWSMEGQLFEAGVWTEDLPQLPLISNGLVAAVPDGVHLKTGSTHGDLRLTIAVVTSAPDPDPDDWEAVVDVSLFTTDGVLATPDGNGEVLLPGPGWYRLRACARGRDQAQEHQYDWAYKEEGNAEPEGDQDHAQLEEHRVVLWPAAPDEERVWKHDGVCGVTGSRRLPALGPDSHPVDLNSLYEG